MGSSPAGQLFRRHGPGADDAVGRLESAPREGAGDLIVQLGAVRDRDDSGLGEATLTTQLGGQPQHGQRLARSLGMPHHTAPL